MNNLSVCTSIEGDSNGCAQSEEGERQRCALP
ncbi:MAG: hypothetical protein ACI9G1_005419, partial [Pirellulaceae bacterium]